MVFNVTLGFNQLENPSAESDRGRVYALLIGDTVLVNKVCTIQYNIGVVLWGIDPILGWSCYWANSEV